jgi:nicotinic acid phosphoribosyltransferase
MTIRLATAASSRTRIRLSPAQARAAIARPCNDNGPFDVQDAMLHAALRQFAKHGIGAAEHARVQAERAFFKGDRETYQWWLEICRTLDRRLAIGLGLA